MKDNPVAHLAEYYLRNLAEHLAASGRVEELHRLLALETSERRNAWYDALETIGDTESYRVAVKQAWQLAEEAIPSSNIAHSAKTIGLQCRYALITASLNSLVRNIPPNLVAALVEHGIWTPAQGLIIVSQAPNPTQRARLLTNLASHLPEPLFEEALAQTREIRDIEEQAYSLIGMAPYLPEPLLGVALAAAQGTKDELWRSLALASLIPRLSEPLQGQVLREALAAVGEIESEKDRAETLAVLAPHLPKPLQRQALLMIQRIEDGWARAQALVGLPPHFPKPIDHVSGSLLRAPLAAVQMELPAGMAPCLPESLLEEALAAAREIRNELWRSLALAGLIPRLSEPLQGQVLREAAAAAWTIPDEAARAFALVELAPYLSKPLLREALVAAQVIGDDRWRADILARLVPYLSEPLKTQVLKDALAATRGIEEWISARAKILARLAPHFSEPLRIQILQEALTATRKIEQIGFRTETLAELTRNLPEALVEEALTEMRAIADVQARARTMAISVADLPEPLKPHLLTEALVTARKIGDGCTRARIQVILASQMPKSSKVEVLEEALTSAQQIGDTKYIVETLTGFIPRLPEPLRNQILRETLVMVQGLESTTDRIEALVELVSHLPEPLKIQVLEEALTLVSGTWQEAAWTQSDRFLGSDTQQGWELSQARILEDIAPYLSEPMLVKALGILGRIADAGMQWSAMRGLVPCLSGPLLEKALTLAQDIAEQPFQSGVKASIAVRLAKLGYHKEALTTIREIATDIVPFIGEALASIAAYLPGDHLPDALAVAQKIRDESERARALVGLAPHLSEPLLRETLAAALEIDYIAAQVEALVGIAQYLPESLRVQALEEALAVSQRTEYEGFRAEALTILVPHLQESLKTQVLGEALAAAQGIDDEEVRTGVLTALLPHLSEPSQIQVLGEILEAVVKVRHPGHRKHALEKLAAHLPKSLLEEAWTIILEKGDVESRLEVLISLAPNLPERLQIDLLEAFVVAHNTADEFKPLMILADLTVRRAEGKSNLFVGPAEPSPFLQEAQRHPLLDVLPVQQTVDKVRLASALEDLVARLAEAGYCQEALVSVRRIEDASVRAEVLTAMLPHLPQVLETQVLEEILTAAQDIGEGGPRARVLVETLTQLISTRITVPDSFWQKALEFLVTDTRRDLLEGIRALEPILFAVGGAEVIVEITNAVQDVCRWWS